MRWFDGMHAPALVVSSEDAEFDLEDAIDAEMDTIVFGDRDNILDGSRHGGRVTLGYWLDDYGKLGIEGDWMGFGAESISFSAGDGPVDDPDDLPNAPPFIGRPFFLAFPIDVNDDGVFNEADGDILPGPSIEEVDTNNVTGRVTVNVESEFQSASLHIRRNICCIAPGGVGCGDCVSCGSGVGGCDACGGTNPYCPVCPMLGTAVGRFFGKGTRHVDMIYGARWAQLQERLSVTEDLFTIEDIGTTPEGTSFLINDTFGTSNEFFGGEIGFIVDWERRRWSLELLSKLAIGSTRQRANLSASTLTVQPDEDPQTFENTGLLVQRSNAGVHERDEFSVMPQIGVTAGYLMTERLRLTAGYTLLYWSRVLRPGDVISLDVDPRQLPPQDELIDLDIVRPQFAFHDTDLWAHGLNFGVDYRW
jgi:hypothetical protein